MKKKMNKKTIWTWSTEKQEDFLGGDNQWFKTKDQALRGGTADAEQGETIFIFKAVVEKPEAYSFSWIKK